MSNLSSIGFNVSSEEEFQGLAHFCINNGKLIRCGGAYSVFTDPSGAELYGQINSDNEIIGLNPHFKGKSRRKVFLTESIADPENALEGSFYAWANPANDSDPESGDYPFIFQVPDFKVISHIVLPEIATIQLAAFAVELKLYADENDFNERQEKIGDSDLKYASRSFVPTDLFNTGEENLSLPTVFFAGIIKEKKILVNKDTKQKFYWMLTDTLGGEADVLFDLRLTDNEPEIGGVVQGSFWLSGKILNTGALIEERIPFWKKLFK